MSLWNVLFPPQCALCRAPLGAECASGLCLDCQMLMQRDRQRKLHRSLLYLDVICAAEYSGAMRGALLRVKESGKNAAVMPMAHTLLSARQAGMNKQRRKEHAQSSLSLAARAVERIAGKRILLVDDIIASGATMNQAARLLREAGASEVVGLALAKSTKDR